MINDQATIFFCVACRQANLQPNSTELICPACHTTFPLVDGIPIFQPSLEQQQSVHPQENGDLSLNDIQSTYDLAYSHDGLMGTDLDKTYDQFTKETLLNFGAPLQHKSVLDIGTGIGNLWQYVHDEVDGHALDLSLVGVTKAKQTYDHLTVSVAVAEYLPYPDNYFDFIIAADTLEHTLSPQQALTEIHRVLKPNGILAASFPIPDSLRKWGRNQLLQNFWNPKFVFRLVKILAKRTLLFGRPDFQPIDRDYTPDEWLNFLQQTGFQAQPAILWPPQPEIPIVTLVASQKI
ncbi:MAG TPA: methyltransferase domain-containing protein [Anaerolineae bacterium]|nr:methyltransferase domain-containing protein [Anaerolineae bacterium]